MFMQTPLINFNKNNPFVIISRQRYHRIYDEISECSKILVKHMVYVVPSLVVIMLIALFISPSNNHVIMALIIWSIIINVYTWFECKKRLVTEVMQHPMLLDFEKKSNNTIDDITNMENTDILKMYSDIGIVYGHAQSYKESLKYTLQKVAFITLSPVIIVLLLSVLY